MSDKKEKCILFETDFVIKIENKLFELTQIFESKNNLLTDPALQELIGELDETFTYEFDALNTQKTLEKASSTGSKFIAKIKKY